MTSYAVIDPTFTKSDAYGGVSAAWLRWELERCGIIESDARVADVLLVTMPSAQEFYDVPRALKRIGVPTARGARSQRVVLGGGIGLAPAIADDVADVVCVGEGPGFIRTMLLDGLDAASARPESWVPGETRDVIPAENFPWDLPPVRYEDGSVRLVASRGCRKACLFCPQGWGMRYAEHPAPDALIDTMALLRADGERVSLTTNDFAGLSFAGQVTETGDVSASFDYARRLLDGETKLRSIRLGVEGVSERMRAAVGKPIDARQLVDLSCSFMRRGVSVRWFMIAGLPGETDDDWRELYDAASSIRKSVDRGAIGLSFTAFLPNPAAPLCLAPIDDAYWGRYKEFESWFFLGDGFSRRIQIMRPAAPEGRMRRSMALMAADEPRLRRGWDDTDPPSWRIRYGRAPRPVMRRAWETYRRRVGLPAVAGPPAASHGAP